MYHFNIHVKSQVYGCELKNKKERMDLTIPKQATTKERDQRDENVW